MPKAMRYLRDDDTAAKASARMAEIEAAQKPWKVTPRAAVPEKSDAGFVADVVESSRQKYSDINRDRAADKRLHDAGVKGY